MLFICIGHENSRINAQNQHVAYLYAYFSGDESRLDDQQIYFAVSKDGITWDDLNENNPVLSSVLGDKGVRDPYIVRSPSGDRFFLIATDLDIRASKYNGNWGLMSTQGSTHIMVWESTDLINWEPQRMVNVSSSIGAGNTWAPETIYDETTGDYLVYWSSRVSTDNFAKHRIYVSKTKDFKTFTTPQVFVETVNSCIDASIYKQGDTYYRLIKDEKILSVSLSSTKVLLDYSTPVLGSKYNYIQNTELEGYKGGYEGPTMFKFLNENKWCVLVDEYTGSRRGYIPFISNDISAANSLHLMPDNTYLMPTGAKHGTVIPITQTEYDNLTNKWGIKSPVENVSQDPVLHYDFNETPVASSITDVSGNNRNGKLFGKASIVNDATKGNVLYLDGSSGTYLEFPKGFFDGRSKTTISMDLKPESDEVNHFTFTIGLNNKKYMFLRTRPNQIRNAITTLSYSKERDIISTGSFKSKWMNIKIVMDGHKMSMYIDNKLINTNNYVRSINDLGKNLISYLGKSFYSGDPYFKGYFDNIKVYNRALTHAEITTGISEFKKLEGVKITPVPFDKSLTIAIPEMAASSAKIQIHDISGKLVSNFESSQSEIALSTSHLPEGTYLISVLKDGKQYSQSVIKN